MAKVTLKDSKNTIWEAYNEALKTINDLKSEKMDPIAEKEMKRVEEVITQAEKISAEEILNPKIIADFMNIKEAIEIKAKELEELTGIEDRVLSLVALVNAQSDIERTFKEEMSKKKEALEQELSDIKAMISQTKADRAAEELEYGTRLTKERKREKEEYTYNRDRERKIENDKWADEKAERQKTLKLREDACSVRETEVLEKETIVKELEDKVATIPSLEEAAYEEGMSVGKSSAEKSFKFEKQALEARFNSDKSILENKITYLEDTNSRLTAELEKARAEVIAARTEVKDIASEALSASGNSKMITQMQDFARDLNTKNGK